MPLDFVWDDDAKTVIRYRARGRWNWNDFHKTVRISTFQLDRLDHDTTFLWLDAIVLAITVVNFAWTFHPSFVIVKPLLLSISMVLFVTMQM